MDNKFSCPKDVEAGSKEVLGGLYFTPNVKFATPPTILDIGANVGAYSYWANKVYPDCKIIAYEPHPKNFSYLRKNVAHIEDITLVNKAVLGNQQSWKVWNSGKNTVLLREGVHNCGEMSVYDVGEQKETGIEVEFTQAQSLPEADILKVDAEGVELEIIQGFVPISRLKQVCFEWHRLPDYFHIGSFLYHYGFRLDKRVNYPSGHRGVMIFVREENNG